MVQWGEDQARAAHERQWLRCEVDEKGEQVLIILATPTMLHKAVRFGHGGPIYMDASHGMQRYGLKVATVHVKDNQSKGTQMSSLDM